VELGAKITQVRPSQLAAIADKHW